MRRLFYCDSVGSIGSVGLLVLRIVVGAAFMHHGWGKIQDPSGWTGWMGPNMPAVLQALAVSAEFGGGAALILGVMTRLACLGIATVMIVALAMVHLPMHHPFVNTNKGGGPSYELAANYLACAVLFFIVGPGRLSIDAFLFSTPEEGKPLRGS